MSPRAVAILSSATLFSCLSILPKILSLGKDMLVAIRFGVGEALDIYLLAFVLIGVPVSIIVVALQTILIPELVNKNTEQAAVHLNEVVVHAIVLLISILPFWLILLPYAFEFMYSSLQDETRARIISACIWLIPYYFMNGINLLLYGSLQARKIFWPNAVFPGLFPLAILFMLLLFRDADIRALLIGTVLGSFLEFLLLLNVLNRERLLKWKSTLSNRMKPMLRQAFPLIISGIISAMIPVIEQLIAFRLGEGSISLLNYGYKVPAALSSLMLTAIGVVILPHFAELITNKEWLSCRRLHIQISFVVVAIGLIVACIGYYFSVEIISVLFERGAFNANDTRNAANVMSVYLFQLPFMLMMMVSMRALIALNMTIVITASSAVQIIIAASVAYVMSEINGVIGVAQGALISSVSSAFIMSYYALNKLKNNSVSKRK